MLFVFSTCKALIRTLPALQHDHSRAEDVDTEQEDHAPDEARYSCMSRPYVTTKPDAESAIATTLTATTIQATANLT